MSELLLNEAKVNSGEEIISCYGMVDQNVNIDPEYTYGEKKQQNKKLKKDLFHIKYLLIAYIIRQEQKQ